jgi:IclR family transcriptional regulator, mhp operon transcriptional activator
MESTRPIRALMRGLDALTVLNVRDGTTVSEVAHEIRLPRTTVYRILETLCSAGYVFRDASDDRYRLTVMVKALSEGFNDEAWVAQIAKPLIDELGREIIWPLSIATFSGTTMMIRATTDHGSPLAAERYSAGFRLPLLTSAAGRVYLAFCGDEQRGTLLSKDDLAEIRGQGYATSARARHTTEEISTNVPVLVEDRALAALSLRFTATALPLPAALERFLPKLRECAADISTQFVERQPTALRQAPDAAA